MRIPELDGRRLTNVDGSAAPGQWLFRFGGDHTISVECDWRIVVDGAIALAARDHEQLFGLRVPVNAIVQAQELLSERQVADAAIGVLGDLSVTFTGGARLETFANSSGYESCTISLPDRLIVVLGSGAVEEFPGSGAAQR
jgi:hypothetical protein